MRREGLIQVTAHDNKDKGCAKAWEAILNRIDRDHGEAIEAMIVDKIIAEVLYGTPRGHCAG